MAVKARIPEPLAMPVPPFARRELPIERTVAAAGIKRDPAAPTVGVHWKIVAIALGAAVWFVVAAIVFYASGDAAYDYLLWIVAGFAVLFFALTLGLARWAADDPRWTPRKGRRPFAEFIDGNVAIFTGAIHGREATTQLLTIPVSLALGATLIGIVFWIVS